MAAWFVTILCSVGCVCIATLAWRVLDWLWFTPKRLESCLRQQGIPGTSYKLFHGDSKNMSTMIIQARSKPISLTDNIVPRVLPFQHQLISKFGKTCFMWAGTIPRLHIMDPKLIVEILGDYKTFQKPRTNPQGKLLLRGIILFEGQHWANRRKILNPAFHLDKIKHMFPLVQLSCENMLNQWEILVLKNERSEFDAWPYIENLTADVISRTAFGSNYEEGRKIFQLQREQSILLAKAMQKPYLPGRSLVPTKANKRMKHIYEESKSTVKEIIDKRLKLMEMGEVKNDDLLDLLMESSLIKSKLGMSIDDVIDECKTFYFAGQETTANLLAWTIVLLSRYSNWQTRARDEVLQVFGKNKSDFNGISHLKVVSMILYEVLRLYSPAPEMVRLVTKDIKLGELTLPKGLVLSLPLIFIHRDIDIWGKDAQEFKPERFFNGISKATNNQLAAFFPFSLGPRVCIGQSFSLTEAKVALAMILQKFSFELSPSYVHAPLHSITLKPQYGVPIILRKI